MLAILHALVNLRARRVRAGLDAMTSAEARVDYLTDAQFSETFSRMSEHEAFVERRGLEFAGAFELSAPGWVTAHFLVWRNREQSTFLTANVLPNQFLTDVATWFEGGVTLTTTQNVGAVMIPEHPLEMFEVFPKFGLDELWQAHEIAVNALVNNSGVAPEMAPTKVPEMTLHAARERAAHVKSLWYWKFECFWRLVRWESYVNKPVRELPARTKRALRRAAAVV